MLRPLRIVPMVDLEPTRDAVAPVGATEALVTGDPVPLALGPEWSGTRILTVVAAIALLERPA